MAADKLEDHATELLTQAVNLLAILVTRGLPDSQITQKEQILLLSSAGLQPRAIADLLGTTPGTVSVRLAEGKRRKKAKEKKV